MAEEQESLKDLLAASTNIQQRLLSVVDKMKENGEGSSGMHTMSTADNFTSVRNGYSARDIGRAQSVVQGLNRSGIVQRSSGFNTIWNPSNLLSGTKRQTRNQSSSSNQCTPTNVGQDIVPDSNERANLQIAGLGEHKLQLPIDSDSDDIYDELIAVFPKLRGGGGFELLKTHERSKVLSEIEVPPAGYTVAYLKAVLHNAKAFVRPLQRDLSLEPEKEEIEFECIVKEECMFCKQKIGMNVLRKHLEDCEKRTNEVLVKESLPELKSGTSCDVRSPSPSIPDYDDFVPQESANIDKDDVILLDGPETDSISTIQNAVESLSQHIDESCEFDMIVRRSSVLDDALCRLDKASFDPRKKLNVEFVGEMGSDTGGLTREFFTLLRGQYSSYFDSHGCIMHNSLAVQDNVYCKLGILAGMALSHGGGIFPVISKSIWKHMCGTSISELEPDVDEIGDTSKRTFLEEMNNCDTVTTLHELLSSNYDWLVDIGFTKPIAATQLTDRNKIARAVKLHCTVLGSSAEILQFRDGMYKIEGLKRIMKNHGNLLVSFYCSNTETKMTSDNLRRMFNNIKFSELGSNHRITEERVYMFFIKFMDECEEGTTDECVTLPSLLSFFTGADTVPPTGYSSVTLNFNHENMYPTASTCAIELTLPTKHNDYETFRSHTITAVTMHGGFGLI